MGGALPWRVEVVRSGRSVEGWLSWRGNEPLRILKGCGKLRIGGIGDCVGLRRGGKTDWWTRGCVGLKSRGRGWIFIVSRIVRCLRRVVGLRWFCTRVRLLIDG